MYYMYVSGTGQLRITDDVYAKPTEAPPNFRDQMLSN